MGLVKRLGDLFQNLVYYQKFENDNNKLKEEVNDLKLKIQSTLSEKESEKKKLAETFQSEKK